MNEKERTTSTNQKVTKSNKTVIKQEQELYKTNEIN